MTKKEDREQLMSDEDRLASWKAKGRVCVYCNAGRLVTVITDRLFGCCQRCADFDNKDGVLKEHLPCVCCGKELHQSMSEEKITITSVNYQPFHDGMAGRISCGYGSNKDCNVYMIAICDECIDKKIAEERLVFSYNCMPNV
jgi:hypothetical protein